MSEAAPPSPAPAPALRGRVLVIDDEESIRHGLARGLKRSGFEVETAATGREGVDLFLAKRFDAVLTDVRLPDLSGLDVAAILTEMDPEVALVVMTGYASVDSALDAMRRGAHDYVQKPFSIEAVVHALERALNDRRLTRENRRLRALVERRFAPSAYEQVEAELEARKPSTEPGPPAPAPTGPPSLRDAHRAFEVRYVQDLLVRTQGNVAAAARLAGISRPNFHKKLKALGVDPGPYKQAARRARSHDPGPRAPG